LLANQHQITCGLHYQNIFLPLSGGILATRNNLSVVVHEYDEPEIAFGKITLKNCWHFFSKLKKASCRIQICTSQNNATFSIVQASQKY